MARATVFRVFGVEQALKNFQTLEDALQKRITRLAVLASARVFLQEVRSTTYGAGRTRRTGLLLAAQGISARIAGNEVTAWVSMHKADVTTGGTVGGRPRLREFMPSNVKARHTPFYWWFLERGTAQRITKTTHARRGFVSRRQWVEPAFDAKGQEAIAEFADTVARELDKACASLPQGVGGIPL